MTAPVRFVIFAAPRTGSNLLCSLLGAHPDILCHHGLFNPAGIHLARGRHCEPLGSVAARDSDPLAFLKRVWTASGDARAVGFKINLGENEAASAALLRDTSVCKLLLRRRNRLRTFISEEIAARTGIWESYDPPIQPGLPLINVAVNDLVRHTDRNTAYYAGLESILAATGQDWLQTEYEALSDSAELRRILAWLDVGSRHPLTPASSKRGPAELGAVVANLGELTAALADTSFESELSGRDLPDLRSPLLVS
jgi:hypothetical protein